MGGAARVGWALLWLVGCCPTDPVQSGDLTAASWPWAVDHGPLTPRRNLNYWDSVSTLAGEVQDPSRTFPRALGAAILLVVVSYLVPLLVGLGITTNPEDWQLVREGQRAHAFLMRRGGTRCQGDLACAARAGQARVGSARLQHSPGRATRPWWFTQLVA